MKYRYRLTIEDAAKDEEILLFQGTGTSRDKEGCYKAVRRSITQGMRDYINKSEDKKD